MRIHICFYIIICDFNSQVCFKAYICISTEVSIIYKSIQIRGFCLKVFYCLCVCVLTNLVVSNSLLPQGLLPVRLLCPWEFTGKNTGVACHILL